MTRGGEDYDVIEQNDMVHVVVHGVVLTALYICLSHMPISVAYRIIIITDTCCEFCTFFGDFKQKLL